MKNTDTPHPLYTAALQADEHYSKTISTQFPGKTRWTLTKEENAHPEIDAAYRAKVSADKAWLDTMRAAGAPASVPEKAKGMTLDEMKAHLAQRATEGAFGLTWDQIEKGQGGRLTRNV